MVQQIECLDNGMEDQLDRDYQAAIEMMLSRAAAANAHDMAPVKSMGKRAKSPVPEQPDAASGPAPAAPAAPSAPSAPSAPAAPTWSEVPAAPAASKRQSRAAETSDQLRVLRSVANAAAADSVNSCLLRQRRKLKREMLVFGLLASLAVLVLATCLLTFEASFWPLLAACLGLAMTCVCIATVIHCGLAIQRLDKLVLARPDLSAQGEKGPDTAPDNHVGLPAA